MGTPVDGLRVNVGQDSIAGPAEVAASDESGWLAHLPEDYRARLREDDLEREILWERAHVLARRAWRRTVIEGTVLFLASNVLAYGFAPVALLLSALTGALVGGLWHLLRARQLLSPLIAMTFEFLLLQQLGDISVLVFFCLPFPIGAVAAFLGAERDTRIHG